ncbi:MAG: DNA-binding protein [Micavibrio sp.]|nr:DNA-binding protein [Micavibrio sp.]
MAKLLGVSTQWLEIGRVHGYGPPFIKLTPRMVRYRIGDVKKWLADRVYHSTSEYNSNSGEK